MNSMIRLGGVLLCAASISACATITRGTHQSYVIETDPPGAHVVLSTGQTCTSPCHLRLARKAGFTVTATHDGYQEVHANVRSRVRAGGGVATAGNILFGGLIGGAVDAASGSMNDLRPNPLHIAMAREGSAPAAPAADADGAAETAAAAPAAAPATASTPQRQ